MIIFDGIAYDDIDDEVAFFRLVDIIKTKDIPDHRMTFALEALGMFGVGFPDRVGVVKETITPYLKHKSAIVREGAIYGIAPFIDNDILKTLREMEQNDSSITLREVAAEYIDEYNDRLEKEEAKLAKQLRFKYNLELGNKL